MPEFSATTTPMAEATSKASSICRSVRPVSYTHLDVYKRQIGAFQAVVGSSKFSFSYYITGFLILLGVLLGRFICGFLCPFGWFQELLHKIPTKKLSTKKLRPLTYLKYAVLLVMVFLLPAFLVNDVGMGDPFFCKYLCPQGCLLYTSCPWSPAASPPPRSRRGWRWA